MSLNSEQINEAKTPIMEASNPVTLQEKPKVKRASKKKAETPKAAVEEAEAAVPSTALSAAPSAAPSTAPSAASSTPPPPPTDPVTLQEKPKVKRASKKKAETPKAAVEEAEAAAPSAVSSTPPPPTTDPVTLQEKPKVKRASKKKAETPKAVEVPTIMPLQEPNDPQPKYSLMIPPPQEEEDNTKINVTYEEEVVTTTAEEEVVTTTAEEEVVATTAEEKSLQPTSAKKPKIRKVITKRKETQSKNPQIIYCREHPFVNGIPETCTDFIMVLKSFFIQNHRYVGLQETEEKKTIPLFFIVQSSEWSETNTMTCNIVNYETITDLDGTMKAKPIWDEIISETELNINNLQTYADFQTNPTLVGDDVVYWLRR